MARFTYRRPTVAEIGKLPIPHLSRSFVVEYQGRTLGAVSLCKPNKYERKEINPYTNTRPHAFWCALSWQTERAVTTAHVTKYQAALSLLPDSEVA